MTMTFPLFFSRSGDSPKLRSSGGSVVPEPRDFHGSALIGDIGLAFALVQRLSTNEKPFLCFYPLLFIPPVLPDRLPLLLCYPHSLTLIWDLIMTAPLDFMLWTC